LIKKTYVCQVDAPVYVVHLSTAPGLAAVGQARSAGQGNVYAETCPQYLFLDEHKYDDDREGLKYIMSPPLRPAENLTALWDGINSRQIDTIGTDHCPFFFAMQKQRGREDFSLCPNGAPGVETRMRLLFSAAICGHISLPDVVRLAAGIRRKSSAPRIKATLRRVLTLIWCCGIRLSEAKSPAAICTSGWIIRHMKAWKPSESRC